MSNALKRIIVGVIGIPVILFLIYMGGIYFFILSILLQTVCLFEFSRMFENRKYYPLKIFTILISVIILITSFYFESYLMFSFLIAVIIIASLEIFRKEKRNPVNPMISVFGLLYITVPFILLNDLLLIKNFNVVIYIIVLIWSCDTFAYFGGKYLGKHPLNTISPKKTREGTVIGFVFAIAASMVFYYYFPEALSLQDALIVGSTIGVFGQVGDLFESMLKRFNDVKDSSQIIPGHGGVLDRFDSLVFVTPIVFVYFNYIK